MPQLIRIYFLTISPNPSFPVCVFVTKLFQEHNFVNLLEKCETLDTAH